MQDRETTGWTRSSDTTCAGSATRQGAPRLRPNERESQLQTWEGEGGRTGVSSGAVRILIVDDDMASADSLERTVLALGYSETRVAYSGRAALAIAAEFQPNVVLLDLSLLAMSGYELAQSLRAQAQSRHLRLIGLTASREHTAREQARAAGFERYLLKPIAALELSNLVEMPPQ